MPGCAWLLQAFVVWYRWSLWRPRCLSKCWRPRLPKFPTPPASQRVCLKSSNMSYCYWMQCQHTMSENSTTVVGERPDCSCTPGLQRDSKDNLGPPQQGLAVKLLNSLAGEIPWDEQLVSYLFVPVCFLHFVCFVSRRLWNVKTKLVALMATSPLLETAAASAQRTKDFATCHDARPGGSTRSPWRSLAWRSTGGEHPQCVRDGIDK